MVVRYGKLLLDTDRNRCLLCSTSFSFPLSPNQGRCKQEGIELNEPDGETSGGSSIKSPQDPLLLDDLLRFSLFLPRDFRRPLKSGNIFLDFLEVEDLYGEGVTGSVM